MDCCLFYLIFYACDIRIKGANKTPAIIFCHGR